VHIQGDHFETKWCSTFVYGDPEPRARWSQQLMKEFRGALSDCDVYDLGFTRTPWTYDNRTHDNKQTRHYNVCVRLDHTVASPTWKTLFPGARLVHIVSSQSDHHPLFPRPSAATEEAWSCRKWVQNLGDISASFRNVMSDLYSWKRSTSPQSRRS
jgi:hypothetical protein